MKSEYTFQDLVNRYGAPIFRREIAEYETADLDIDDVPKEIAVFKNDKHISGVVCFSCYGNHWYANCGERYAIRELLKSGKFQVEKVDRYWYKCSRNYDRYVETTYLIDLDTGERKESTRSVEINYNENYNLPEWARAITEHRRNLDISNY